MNEIFKEWLDKQPPLSVNPLHNGQYYLTDEQALDFAKYYSNKQLLLHNVVKSLPKCKNYVDGQCTECELNEHKECNG